MISCPDHHRAPAPPQVSCWPASRNASRVLLQRRQIMQLGWPLSLILDAHGKRTLEAASRIDYVLSNLTQDNSVLRRVPHLKLAAATFALATTSK